MKIELKSLAGQTRFPIFGPNGGRCQGNISYLTTNVELRWAIEFDPNISEEDYQAKLQDAQVKFEAAISKALGQSGVTEKFLIYDRDGGDMGRESNNP